MNARAAIARATGATLGRDFARYWLATTGAVFGSAFTLVAIPLLASIALKASAAQVGLIAFLELLPYLVFGLFVGTLADRVPSRRLMIGSHLLRAGVLCAIPAAAVVGGLSVRFLYVTSFLFGTLTVIFDVAYQAYLPALVGKEKLLEANGRLQFSRSSAQLSAPGIAGMMVQLVTAPFALIIDAVALVGAAAMLGTVRHEDVRPEGSGAVLKDMRDGLSFVMRDRTLRALGWSLAALYFFVTAMNPLVILFAARTLRVAPVLIGVAYTVGGAGTLVGAVANVKLIKKFGLNRVIMATAAFASLGPVCVAVAGRSTIFPLLLLGELLMAAGGTIFAVAQVSLRQHVTPMRMQGRMNGIMRFLGIGGNALGALAAGLTANVIGLRPTLALACLGGLIAVACIATSPIARLRNIDDAGATPARPAPAGETLVAESAS